MKVLRRTLVALGLAVIATTFVRLRGSGGTPPRRGGWRELQADELGRGGELGSGGELGDGNESVQGVESVQGDGLAEADEVP